MATDLQPLGFQNARLATLKQHATEKCAFGLRLVVPNFGF
jgi:hypothetical protein